MKAPLHAESCRGSTLDPHSAWTWLGLWLLVLAISQTGCVTTRKPSAENGGDPGITLPSLAELGVIGVTSTNPVPTFTVREPLSRTDAGELTARRIVFLGGDDFTDDTSMLVNHLTLGIAPFVLSALAVPSRTFAQAIAVPENRLSIAVATLDEAIDQVNLQEELRTRVVQQTTARTSTPIKLVRKPFPPGREAEFSRMSCVMAGTLAWLPRGHTATEYLAEQGIDTVLELQLVHPGLKGSGKINPSLRLCLDVRARLAEASTGRELWRSTTRYRSAKHKFTEWAADDARTFRSELDRAFTSIAKQIAIQLTGELGEPPSPSGAEFARN